LNKTKRLKQTSNVYAQCDKTNNGSQI